MISTAIIEYRNSLKEFLDAYVGIKRSDAFINILNAKIDKKILSKHKLDILLSSLANVYPDRYIDELFLVRLVTLLEEFLKNKLIEEFSNNEEYIIRFLNKYNTDRRILIKDVIAGPRKLALDYLDEVIFHNLPKVEKIYLIALSIDIKELCNFKTLMLMVKIRHLIVHTRGKFKANEKLNSLSFQLFINQVNQLVENIEYVLKNGRIKKRHNRIKIQYRGKEGNLIDMQDLINYEVIKAFS